MTYYIIIETNDGQAVVSCSDGQTAEDAAEANGGILVDEGPFDSFEEARDALEDLDLAEDDA